MSIRSSCMKRVYSFVNNLQPTDDPKCIVYSSSSRTKRKQQKCLGHLKLSHSTHENTAVVLTEIMNSKRSVEQLKDTTMFGK